MKDYFFRMPAFLQERIHAEGWESWRDVQQQSFEVLFDSDDHLLITAGTSSGKTEAAMFPVISSLYDDPPEGVGALYIGPTKALIDDQFMRLDRVLRDSKIAVTGWHGDIPMGDKERMRRNPEGILQITPESLQGVICDGPGLIMRMFSSLRFVIIDEVHAFMASDRGLQLLCELEMIERIAGCSPRRIGLSATLSNTSDAEAWLKAGTERRVVTVSSDPGQKGRIGLKYYRIPAEESRKEEMLRYYKELFRLTDQYSCIVFTNSRGSAEKTASSLRKVSEREGSRNRVEVHHGSLSGQLRKIAEDVLKGGGTDTVVATSTLELGVDIGGLDRVVQVGAPYTCSSLMQRLGRTGRRGGRKEMIIIVLDDMKGWSSSPPGMSINLVRAIAVADLAVGKGWTEPIRTNTLPFGLLYHQMMAYLKGADHDVVWSELRDAMLSLWVFRNVTPEEILELARHLLTIHHLERMEDGTLVIGLDAEPVANGRGFASVFEAAVEYEIRSKGVPIGSVQKKPKEGAVLCLAGRMWEIKAVGDGWADAVEVKEEIGDARWESTPPEVDARVMQRMREILMSDEEFPWMDSASKAELEATRATFRAENYDGYVDVQGGYLVFPWAGTRAFEGMRRALDNLDDVDVMMSASPIWLRISTDKTQGMVENGLKRIIGDSDPEDFVLMEDIDSMGKYERYVPDGLRAREFAANRLDFNRSQLYPRIIEGIWQRFAVVYGIHERGCEQGVVFNTVFIHFDVAVLQFDEPLDRIYGVAGVGPQLLQGSRSAILSGFDLNVVSSNLSFVLIRSLIFDVTSSDIPVAQRYSSKSIGYMRIIVS